jgi:hypothetical protein
MKLKFCMEALQQSQHFRMVADVRNRMLGSSMKYNPSEMLLIFLGISLDRCNTLHCGKLCSIRESVVLESVVMIIMDLHVLLKGLLHYI